MIHINLLPWREQARQLKLTRFYKQLGAVAVFALIVVFVMHSHYNGLLKKQQKRVSFLQSQISTEGGRVEQLREKLKLREDILSQMAFIATLRAKGYQSVEFLNELIRISPEGVYFNRVDFKDSKALLIGRATSNLKITLLLKNIAQSTLFQNPDLTEISVKGTSMGEERVFQLTFTLEEKV